MGEKFFVIKDREQGQHGTSIVPPFGRSVEVTRDGSSTGNFSRFVHVDGMTLNCI